MTISQLLKVAPVTVILVVVFVGMYAFQVLSGVDANNPSTEALVQWGANVLPLTMMDEPWRVISSAFLHVGLMHLLFNAFAMVLFGRIAEPLFGSLTFAALFFLSAIGGNLLNNYVTWQGLLEGSMQPNIAAGASGGIMGIGAALLVAALFKLSIDGRVLSPKSMLLIMGINLVYGFAVPGIDNAAHIGGAITGGVIALAIAIDYKQRGRTAGAYLAAMYQQTSNGVPYIPVTPTSPNQTRGMTEALPWIVMLILGAGFVWWWYDIHNEIIDFLTTAAMTKGAS
ncbi:rhomboid family intramembrane serine protease [Psychrobacter aestuarii]|uniref:Peptidase S54 rhomboid domain-containing protein n=1 Tax=Psychrobacter aestuarii TaxID=556327 RepID=A0ABN0VLR0_9GAMM|nr:rhomboid family intramembrane serine protease [Psychrobacter aestuarii]